MSWLTVKGRHYVCEKCDKEIYVEYAGGALLTLVGDDVIMEQQRLAQRYGRPQTTIGDPAWYVHRVVFCPACAHQVVDERRDILERADANVREAVQCCDRADQLQRTLDQRRGLAAGAWLSRLDVAALERTCPGLFRDTIGDPNFDRPVNRKHFTKRFVEGGVPALEAAARSEIENMAEVAGVSAALAATIDEARQISESVAGRPLIALNEIDVRQPENLNNHICTEQTMRAPVENTPQTHAYELVELDPGAIIETVRSKAAPGPWSIERQIKRRVAAILSGRDRKHDVDTEPQSADAETQPASESVPEPTLVVNAAPDDNAWKQRPAMPTPDVSAASKGASEPAPPTLGRPLAILSLVALADIGVGVATYVLLQLFIPWWAAWAVAFIPYWLLRNQFVIRWQGWVYRTFRAVGLNHRATNRELSGTARFVISLTLNMYGDPLGAYDGRHRLDVAEKLFGLWARIRGRDTRQG